MLRKYLFKNIDNPLQAIELVIGYVTIIGALYVMSSLIDYSTSINGRGALIQSIGSGLGLKVFGILFLLSGLFMVIGTLTNRYRIKTNAIFWNIVLRIYSISTNFLITGIFPVTWLSHLAIIIILFICYLVNWDIIHSSDNQ